MENELQLVSLTCFEHSVEFDLVLFDVLLVYSVSSSYVDMFAIDRVYPIAYNVAPFHVVIILAQINLEKMSDYLVKT